MNFPQPLPCADRPQRARAPWGCLLALGCATAGCDATSTATPRVDAGEDVTLDGALPAPDAATGTDGPPDNVESGPPDAAAPLDAASPPPATLADWWAGRARWQLVRSYTLASTGRVSFGQPDEHDMGRAPGEEPLPLFEQAHRAGREEHRV